MQELKRKQRDEEKNFKKMRWPCKSCMLSDDPSRNQNFEKPLQDFGVRCASDFVTKLLPQGAWARCLSCQGDRRAELGGNTNNTFNEERSVAAAQACETCTQCGQTLTIEFFWPEDWRHRMTENMSIKCKECCPTPRKERAGGFTAKNEQASIEAAGKPITCQVCERSLPRSQFRKNAGNKFDFRKPMTCEECRAEGNLPTRGWKKRRLA